MKKLSQLLGIWMLVLTATTARAQQPAVRQTHYLGARQAADLALKQRLEIANARLDVANQEAYNKEITGNAYPQIKGNLGLQRNFNIPVTVLPDFISPSVYGILEREGVQDAQGNPIKWDGVVNTFPAAFGVPWQASVGLSVQQLLFQPDVFIGLKARNSALKLYEDQLKVAEDTVRAGVYRAYYGVLVAEKGMTFAMESRDRLTKLYAEQQQLFKNGFIESLDLDRTKVNLNNIESGIDNVNSLIAISYAALKFRLGLPQTDSLVLTDTLSSSMVGRDVFGMEAAFKYEDRNEINALETSNDLLELQIRRYKMNAYPTVAAFWNMATNAQRLQFNFFDTKERWFFSNIAGLNVSVPIFDGFQRTSRVKQANIAMEKNRNTIDLFKQGIDVQIVNSRNVFSNAYKALTLQQENKALAEKVFETTKLKYQRGLGSSFEVLQTETNLQDALNNYYQSLYNAVLAKINYLQALGKL